MNNTNLVHLVYTEFLSRLLADGKYEVKNSNLNGTGEISFCEKSTNEISSVSDIMRILILPDGVDDGQVTINISGTNFVKVVPVKGRTNRWQFRLSHDSLIYFDSQDFRHHKVFTAVRSGDGVDWWSLIVRLCEAVKTTTPPTRRVIGTVRSRPRPIAGSSP